MRILIALSDQEERERFASLFRDDGCIVDLADAPAAACESINRCNHDVLLIGKDFGDPDGVELCRWFRRNKNGTPIILLSDSEDTEETVRALDAGADDYLTRPVNIDELLARTRAMVRRCLPEEGARLCYDGLELDLANRNVHANGEPLILTPREFSLLEYLMRNRERVVSRNALGDRVWGLDFRAENSNVVDVYVSRLRRKLKAVGMEVIHTVHRSGYMLAARPPAR